MLRPVARGRWGRLAVLACLALLAACDASPPAASRVDAFLEWYWNRPLPLQRTSAPSTAPHDSSLDPASCGACHAAQLEGWRGSRHGRAMGPGVLGQLADMAPHATQEHQDCIRCHAPLGEQAKSLVVALAGERNAPSDGRALHEQGLICAACHVRGGRWYGPPRRDGSSPPGDGSPLPHAGWTASTAFEDSRFCAVCHQFDAGGYALNGKLLENTYEEWKASRHAREGRTCQSCHMPDRRHLWRGIHDLETVKAGIDVHATVGSIQAGTVSAALAIENTGTGHYFPTYVTPKVVAEVLQETADGRPLPGTLRERLIARQVPLDLSREIADTRIAPGGRAVLDYRAPLHADAAVLVFRVRVEPDAFYADLYRSLLERGPAGKGEKLIRQALQDANASAFTLYSERRRIPAQAASTPRP